MPQYFQITSEVPVPEKPKAHKGQVMNVLYALEPGQSFLCPHYAGSTINLLQKTDPSRKFKRRKEAGGVRIWRIA